VLEHSDDARRFLQEIQRVGQAGYIETPSEIGEWLYGWEYHHWLVNRVGDRLVLRPKRGKSPFGKLFHTLAAEDGTFARFHQNFHHLLLTQLEWRGEISYEIRESDDAPFDLNDASTIATLLTRPKRASLPNRSIRFLWDGLPLSWRLKIKGVLSQSEAVRRPRPDLNALLVCPNCHGAVEWTPTAVVCPHDRLRFRIENGVPIMLLSDAQPAAP
jgi:uncharacterized protein YbaR (Trm112 family)